MALIMPFGLVSMKGEPVKAAEENASMDRAIIPKPLAQEVTEGKFILTEEASIYVQGISEDETNEIFKTGEYLAGKLGPSTGYDLNVIKSSDVPVGNIYLTTIGASEDLGNEGYEITTTTDGVKIVAYKAAGLFNGIQTLRQLLPASIEKSEVVTGVEWSMPCTTIFDKPEYEYRGMMLDVARHFAPVDELKRQIDLASQYKINKLHIHLSDDQGWRLEIKSWPDLAIIGGNNQVGGGPGGYYTQEEFKDIIQYASERYIEIIPEFDLPGHTNAMLASYGFLNPDGQKKPQYTGIDVGFSSLMTRDEATYAMLDDIIREVSAISPSKYFHIGGDEAHSTPKAEYDYFLGRVNEIVNKYGKTSMGWDPIDTVPGIGSDSILQNWSGSNTAAQEKGMKIVVSKAEKAYIDMKYDANSPWGLQWAGFSSIDDAYDWDPTDYAPKELVFGLEAALFAETIVSREAADYMIYPRLAGHAEIAWTPKEMRSWDEYKGRLIAHGERLTNQGVGYYKDPDIWEVPYVPFNSEWDMNEGTGTVITDKTGKNTATLTGQASWTENGVNGSGISLNGNGYVQIGREDLKGDWTAAIWVNKDKSTDNNVVLFGGDEGDIKLEQYNNTKKVGLTKYGVSDNTFNYTVPEGEWVHLTIVSGSDGTTLYVNGKYQDKIGTKIKGPAKRIGASAKSGLATAGNMKGSIDEAKIFNKALTPEEVAELPGNVQVDKSELQTAINNATEIANNAVVGTESGQYTKEAKDTLISEIALAQDVLDNTEATLIEVTEAVEKLNAAVDTFKNSVNILLNKAQNIAVKELSNNSITVAWEKPNVDFGLEGYVVYVDGEAFVTVGKDVTSYKVANLKNNTIHGVKVTAKYRNEKESKPISINARTKSTDVEKKTFKVATFNTATGRQSENGLQGLKDQLRDYDIDIAGLQEIDKNTNRTGKVDQLEVLKGNKLTNGYFGKAINHDGGEYGIGALSSLEISSSEVTQLPSPSVEQRVYQRYVVNVDGKEIAVYNTHLSYEKESLRKDQMEILKAVMDADKAEYKILTGDFNVDDVKEYNLFADNYNIINGYNGKWHETYNDDDCITPCLDNIIVSKNIGINNIEMVKNNLSDHNMLYAEIEF
ncbi:family 20 glycosylhydrolase [Clostridium sp.]|uniref:family 20 glycosylhydrolase n=1 Tax=Clostridium sp. TaxID=1506 RepID=UPI003F320B0B